MHKKQVYLMRGLPCCGKSYTAKKLAGDRGLVLDTDEYFYKHVGDDSGRYDYSDEALTAAREWNFERFIQAVKDDLPLIIVDRGNNLSAESYRYARCAVDHGCEVEFKEPESETWQEIRVLLKYRPETLKILYRWADRLAEQSRSHHRIPASLIRRGMEQWQLDLTVQYVLAYGKSTVPTYHSEYDPTNVK